MSLRQTNTGSNQRTSRPFFSHTMQMAEMSFSLWYFSDDSTKTRQGPLPQLFSVIAYFTCDYGLASSSLVYFLYLLWNRNSGINAIDFLWDKQPSCHPTNSVRALKEIQSTDPNQGTSLTGLIISSSTTRLLRKDALLPLHQLSDASTTKYTLRTIAIVNYAQIYCHHINKTMHFNLTKDFTKYLTVKLNKLTID